MTRTLTLLRHAKSDWRTGTTDDHERPLNARGQRAAAVIGVYLNQVGLAPDLVLTSTAVRARETCARVLHHAGLDIEVVVEPALYLANPAQILTVIQGQDANRRAILIICHNPGLQDLVAVMAAQADPALRSVASEGFPTAALATAELSESWSDASIERLRLTGLTNPKALI